MIYTIIVRLIERDKKYVYRHDMNKIFFSFIVK